MNDFSPVQEYLGLKIDYKRDKDIPEQGLALLTGRGFYKKAHENSPQESFARAATCYSFGDKKFAQRMYDYASKGWFTNASPVLSNAQEIQWPDFTEKQFKEAGEWLKNNVEPEGMPISCFLSFIPDTKEGLVTARSEAAWLSMMGGGVGIYAGMRAPDEQSTGVMAHMRGYDADTLSYKQTASRRGSMAAYLDIDHPEIVQFIDMRNPASGGDMNKKCFNLNNAINITDNFMKAVIRGEKYELIDPKHGKTGRFLDAREVWHHIMETRYETGEPYLMFKDTVNRNIPSWITHPLYSVSQSNLCVAPETRILTRDGYQPIVDLEGETLDIWNGEEWSEVTVRKTGKNQKLLKVITNSGQELECTPYHKFYVAVRGEVSCKTIIVEKRASELKNGDKLIKFNLPIIQGEKELKHAYANGFYSGDGTLSAQGKRIYLYHEKRKLKPYLGDIFHNWYVHEAQNREFGTSDHLLDKFFVPNEEYSVESRIKWLEGLLDADGCVVRNGKTQSLQISSVEEGFLQDTQMMLQTLGVLSKVVHGVDAGYRPLPANDGSGEMKEFFCKASKRLLIGQTDINKLQALGFNPKRLVLTDHKPNRECTHFIKVVEVVDEGRVDDTYCFTEHKRGMGMFNGILTGQCSEITLRTTAKRTAVCCLSSLNLDKYDEWKDTNLVADMIRYLDNVLEYFILLAPEPLKRAVHSAKKERALGLGTLGWHSLLQRRSIAFESQEALALNKEVYWDIKNKAVVESKRLGKVRGEAPDCLGSGMRNSCLLAIAPNASSSSMVGVSPSIEPWNGNAFNAQGRAGSFLIKNRYLIDVLRKYDKDTKEVWRSIVKNEGSVQHLSFLSDHEKAVFKTATEIDQMWIVELAAQRQPAICQSQSLNIFVNNNITLQQMSDLHIQGWLKGVKTFYYCRSKPATRADVGNGKDRPLNSVNVVNNDDQGCVACEA